MDGARHMFFSLVRNPRPRIAAFACALLWLMLASLAACSHSPPETRLRERITAMQGALEARRPADFVAGIAEDFDGESDLDREGVRNLLRLQLLRNAKIGATIGPIQIELRGERATVTFTAVLTGGTGGLMPTSAQGWKVTSGWRDGPQDWQVIQARWEPVL